MQGRTVLVTGATGFIGKHLCRQLVLLGANVHGVARSVGEMDFACQQWSVDLGDLDAVKNIMSEIKPQVVYHLAGLVTARQECDLVLPMLEANLLGTVNLLLALDGVGCERIVVAGSSEEKGTGPEGPGSPYAAAKLAATQYALMFQRVYSMPVTVAQFFMGYGPGQGVGKLIPYIIDNLLLGKVPEISSGTRVCDFVYVFDLVRGLLKMADCSDIDGKVIELGAGQGIRIDELCEQLVEITGSDVRPQFGVLSERVNEGVQVANGDVAQQLLQWEPKWSLRDGLVETVQWYQTQSMKDIDG